jgi:phosphotriesterase-related protein
VAGGRLDTVCGPVGAESLGFTLPHEHLVYAMTGWQLDHVGHVPRREQVESCVEAVAAAHELGVTALFDLTVPELGRDVDLLAEVSRRTGVHIAGATGLYARYPVTYFVRRSAAEIAEFFIHELVHGVGETGIRPALVKCAVDPPPFAEFSVRVLEAAAQAHRATGAPVVVHVEPGAQVEALHLALLSGIAPGRLVIAHAESTDLDLVLPIVEAGAFAGFDRFGYHHTLSDEERLAVLLELVRRGFQGRIQLSHDQITVFLGRDGLRATWIDRSRDWHLTHLPRDILPRLRAAGLDDQTIRTLTVENPAALFS